MSRPPHEGAGIMGRCKAANGEEASIMAGEKGLPRTRA